MAKIKKKTELLAPAKDLETAIIAINSGADAVYIGAPSFGARQAASNSIEDIEKLVKYAHKFYVKVHVTLNTILTDEELLQAQELIHKLYEIGVDAIIIQDMGIVNLAIENKIPPIPLHASTQCNNRILEKIKFLNDIGLSRVILARELPIRKIEEICKNVKCEIETFIHGALCVSYSGQCYLSWSVGGRSANRGECAQPCRKKYTLTDDKGNIIAKNKYLLSLKDFNASNSIGELVQAGVKSFKIEGRLKDRNYVKNVVCHYRKLLDKISEKSSSGEIFCDFEPDVRKSFNRGFTSYFLKERGECYNFTSPKMQGEYIGKVKNSGVGWFELDRNNDILNPQDGICYLKEEELTGNLINKITYNKIFINRKAKIKKGTKIFRNIDAEYNKRLSKSATTRKIGVEFEYNNNTITATDEDSNKFELKINKQEKPNNPKLMETNFIKQLSKTGDTDFYTKYIKIKSDIPFIPISEINEMRRNILKNLMAIRINNYKRDVQPAINYTNYIKNTVDYKENIHNHAADKFYQKCGCTRTEYSPEYTKNSEGIELMRTKHCLKYAFNMCKSPKKLFLTDEQGKRYRLEFDCKNCEMVIKST